MILDSETKAVELPEDHGDELRLWLRLLTCTTLIEGEVRGRLRERFDVTLPRFDLMAQLDKVPEGMTLSDVSKRMMVSNGNVTGLGYDQWGNTYIQIENDYYVALYMHGVYWPVLGEALGAGQPIGTESNIGYTLDMAGNLCAGRDCGYHTHLNVYDKRLGMNIDPLSLIPASYP